MIKHTKTILRRIIESIIPSLWFKKSHYSQDGEDVVLLSFFEGLKDYKGFYIDIGAHHPFRFSNTALFYKMGWKGINIEPTPSLFNNFILHRKRDINLNIGISSVEGELAFYEFYEGALNTFDKQTADKVVNTTKYKLKHTTSIKVDRLDNILDKHLFDNQKIDFLTIDVEGHDLEVLKSNNWNKYSPSFVLVEGVFNPLQLNDNAIFKFLSSIDYQFIAKTNRTMIYKRT